MNVEEELVAASRDKLSIMGIEETVRAAFAKTEVTYQKCWNILVAMKTGNSNEAVQGIFTFQPILAESLLAIEKTYRLVRKQEKLLIRTRKKYPREEYHKNINRLAEVKDGIEEVIKIGKSIGDAFAFFFYHKEQAYLDEHLKHQSILHMPIGVGASGEIEFIRNVKGLDGRLILYHGITNILRLGDVSFIDLKSIRLVAIGELKSKKDEQNNISIQAHVIGHKIGEINELNENTDVNETIKGSMNEFDLPEEMQARLEKQIKAITESFKNTIKAKPGKKSNMFNLTDTEALNDLARVCKNGFPAYQKSGDGLVYIAVKHNVDAFADKFLTKISAGESAKGIDTKVALEIMDKSSTENSLVVGSLTQHIIMPGMIPMFWWKIDQAFLKEIYFYDIQIATIFNPLYFTRKINNLGFQLKWDNNMKKCTAKKIIGERILKIENVEYFINLIQYNAFSEEKVLEMIKSCVEHTQKIAKDQEVRVDLRIRHHLDKYDPNKD